MTGNGIGASGRVKAKLDLRSKPSVDERQAPAAAAVARPGRDEKNRVRHTVTVSPDVRARSRFCRSLKANAGS